MRQQVTCIFLVYSFFTFLSSCNKQTVTENEALCEPFLEKTSTMVERGFDACGGKNYESPYKNIEAAKKHLNEAGVCVIAIKSSQKNSVFMTCEKSYNGTFFYAEIPSKHVRRARKSGWE